MILLFFYQSGEKAGDASNKGRNSCPLLRSFFIGSGQVGVSKRFSRSISLAVCCLYTFLGPDQVSCRSYVGSAYRMRSLAVSHPELITGRKIFGVR